MIGDSTGATKPSALRLAAFRSRWFAPEPHDERRSVDLVRITVAIVLASHPLHAFAYPEDVAKVAQALSTHGLPAGVALAWAAMVAQLVCAVALVVPRLIVPGAVGSVGLLLGGAAFVLGRAWFVIGGEAEDGNPGIEFNALLIACLLGVIRTYWAGPSGDTERRRAARAGIEIIQAATALSLMAHGWGSFVQRDFEGMHAWGDSMTAAGYPFGVALVWSIKSVELVSSIARLTRRLVVPACLGHLSYLVPALWIEHRLHWFDIGPGENGIEFPLTLVICTVAGILAYLPPRRALDAQAPVNAV